MSTHHTKTNFRQIFEYGAEALGNRRKELILIALVFLVLPQVILAAAWAQASADAVAILGNWTNKAPIDVLEALWLSAADDVAPALGLSVLTGLVGVLALARTCVDYFESRPATLGNVSLRAVRVLFTKGLGTLIFLVLLLPILSLTPLLRAVVLSLLIMLPVTLVTSPYGGFRTCWDTVFLKYAVKTRFGRWPFFINVLSFAGVFLTLMFAVHFLIETCSVADTWLGTPAGFFETELNFFSGKISFGGAIAKVLGLIWDSLWVAITMPFAAATFHMSTIPANHVGFETEA